MKRLVLLVVVFLLCASPVSAEIREGGFSLTLGGLGYLSDGTQHQYISPGFSARFGYDLTKRIGLEAAFDYTYSESTKNCAYKGGRDIFRLDALYYFMPDSRLVPYVIGGVGGIYRDDIYDYRHRGDHYALGALVNYGAGAKFFLTDSIALRADVRQMVVFDLGTYLNAEAMLGVSYYFGRPKQKVTPVAVASEPTAAAAPQPKSRVIEQEEAAPAAPLPAPVPLPAPIDEGPTSWEGTVSRVPAGKVMITGMRIEGNALIINATGPLTNYKVFSLSQPSRLILDLANTVNGMGTDKIAIRKLGIASVRFGSYPDSLRMVLDAEQSELLPYRIEEIENGLKIIMTSPQ